MLKPEQIGIFIFRIAEHAIKGNIHHEVIIARLQKEIVIQALELEGGNQLKTAYRLGVHRNTVARWIAQFGLEAKPAKKQPRRAA